METCADYPSPTDNREDSYRTVKIHTEILALAGRTNIRQFIHIE